MTLAIYLYINDWSSGYAEEIRPDPPAGQAPTTTESCPATTSVAITFNEIVNTLYGQTIKISGSDSTLGNWNTDNALELSADHYTPSNNLWYITISFVPGEVIQYKYINVASDGVVTWENDPDRTYTVPATCTTAVTINNSWR